MAPGSVRMRDADDDSLAALSEDDVMTGSEASEGGEDEEEEEDEYSCAAASDDGEGGSGSGNDSEQSAGSEDPTSEEADLGVLDDTSVGNRSLGYRVIDAESLKRLQRAAIDDVMAIWGCAAGVAKTLLMSYMWDKERLLSEWSPRAGGMVVRGARVVVGPRAPAERAQEAGCCPSSLSPSSVSPPSSQHHHHHHLDPTTATTADDLGDKGQEFVYKAAGLALPDTAASGAAKAAAASSSCDVTCEVCMSELPAAQCSTNSCSHTFCDECWRTHLSVQIGEGKARHVVCMSFKCGTVCDDELVAKVMKVSGYSGGVLGAHRWGRSGLGKAVEGHRGCIAHRNTCLPHSLLTSTPAPPSPPPSSRPLIQPCMPSTARATWSPTSRTTSASPSAPVHPGVDMQWRCAPVGG